MVLTTYVIDQKLPIRFVHGKWQSKNDKYGSYGHWVWECSVVATCPLRAILLEGDTPQSRHAN